MPSIVSNAVNVVRQTARCDCGGVMIPTGEERESGAVAATNQDASQVPNAFGHKCDTCGKRQFLNYVYPRIAYKDV